MSSVTDLLRGNQMRYFDPMGLHFACFQEDTKKLLDAIRLNESVMGFWFDPFVPCCADEDDDRLQQNYLDWCYNLLDACSRLRGLRRTYMNTSHFPLSHSRLCQFLNQAQQLEHFSFGSLVSANNKQLPGNSTNWLDSPRTPLLHVLREHPTLYSFDLHLPDEKSDCSRALLIQLYSLSNLLELRVSFGRACPENTDHHTPCWMSSLLRRMPHLRRLSLRSVVRHQIIEFAGALQYNSRLQELCLVDCHLDERGWEALAQALGTNTHLQVLSIHRGTLFSYAFVTCLAQSLKRNHLTALRTVQLTGFSSEGSKNTNSNVAILALLQTNTTLQSIQVEGQDENEMMELYLKLNRAGRSQWRSIPEACLNCILHHDLDCIYTRLQENPVLLQL